MFCECGCGQPTEVITHTCNRRGMVKGKHRRFVNGHQWKNREMGPDYFRDMSRKQAGVPRPSMKGRKQTPEHVENRTRQRRGRPNPKGSGPLHWNWKGGASQAQRCTGEYLAWMKAVRRRDKHTCQHCGYHGHRGLDAHHVKSWAEHPDLRFDVENGITLCEKCHVATHARITPPLTSDSAAMPETRWQSLAQRTS